MDWNTSLPILPKPLIATFMVYGWFIPEIHFGTYSDLTRYGTFLEISLGAVYHF